MGYGDIMQVRVSGASAATARQDGLGTAGVAASRTMAETDAKRMEKYRSKIERVGGRKGVDPALIAGIISRESRAGNALQNGWGDHGNAWGLMQVDVNPQGGGHTKRGDWDSEEHLIQATEILIYFLDRIQQRFPNWSWQDKLKGGIAAYNMGDGRMTEQSYRDIDATTTGRDYSNDVLARAQWYKTNRGY